MYLTFLNMHVVWYFKRCPVSARIVNTPQSPSVPHMQRAVAAPILRGQLRSTPANGHAAFVPQIRKVVFEFCETWPTSASLRNVLRDGVETIARENPHVEIVVKKRMFKEPVVRGFYCEFVKVVCHCENFCSNTLLYVPVNGRTKEVCVKKMSQREVMDRIQLVLDSSGAKIKPLKGKPVQSSNPSVRGIWSGMHVEETFKI